MAVTVALPSLISTIQVLSLCLIPLLAYALIPYFRPFPPHSPPHISASSSWPLLGALGFFTHRWDFWKEQTAKIRRMKQMNLKATDGKSAENQKGDNFSFRLAALHVIGLNGDAAREFFYTDRNLSFEAGYAVLFGSAPQIEDAPKLQSALTEGNEETPGHFSKRITALLKKDNMEKSLKKLIEDVNLSLDDLGKEGRTDPFESIYRIVFRLTMRTVGCCEISEDRELLERVLQLYQDVEKSATATTILFPWLPTPAKFKRTISATKLYMIISGFVNDRKKTGRTEDDPLQFLIDQGDNMLQIIEFTIGALFAGLINSGINASYVLCYLALPSSRHWYARALAEVKEVAARHTSSPTAPLHEQLLSLPVDVWETEFEFLDLCLKDSIRLHLQGTALRRNVSGRDSWLGEERIPDGAVLAYHLGDIHMDPDVYEDPEKWDPSRYFPERAEDKKKPYGWVGWGTGRHPCLGMRFAKLEQSIIIAFFLARFDYTLTNKDGEPLEAIPKLNLNAHSACRPTTDIFLDYSSKF